MKFNLKTKLITSFTIIIVITGLITAIVGTLLISQGVLNQVEDKVRTDLNSAREILNHRIHNIESAVYFATLRSVIKDSVLKEDRKTLKKYLQEIKEAGNIDILNATDRRGRVILRLHNPEVFGDSQAHDQLIKKVLLEKRHVASPVLIRYEDLVKEGDEFMRCAHIEYPQTPLLTVGDEEEKSCCLMLKTVAPIWGSKGQLIGLLYGGDLINHKNQLVDKIKNIVYQGEKYKGLDMGTATIFKGDLRIATNVISNNGYRAIGTRASGEVSKRVLKEGRQWIGRAFVVNAWHVNAYEPIRDIDGRIIGMLGLGMLEKKFVDIKRRTLLILFGITIFGMVVALGASNFFANAIVKPIRILVRASRQISGGDFSAKVNVETKDELGELEMAFNSMALALKERDEELRNQTQRQLMRSEKMAALGRMAAGIAHEINNPLTGVLMYGHLLRDELPEGCQNWEDAEIIVKETTRCRELIRDLLDFSRETIPHKEIADINEVINKTISIIEKHVYFEKVEIIKELSEVLPEIMIDINQFEQVLINLALNAAESMSDGGKLILRSMADLEKTNVIIKVIDTGSGIPEENIDKIFDPFFTTKEVGKGTGLGLAVTYGIIQRHGGQISVESQIGSGTTFTITLPVEIHDSVQRA
jgi:two-component system NtrC family sensor kinase